MDDIILYLRNYLKNIPADVRKEAIKELILKAANIEKDLPLPKRPNCKGTPIDCPYGIFRSRTECAAFIYDNHCIEFLEKYKGFKVPLYTKKVATGWKDNTPERHYIYWTVVTLCKSKKYPKWNFLNMAPKEID